MAEYSGRAKYVTEQVVLWLENDGEYIDKARTVFKESGLATFTNYVITVITTAKVHSAPWQVAQELAPNDYHRIHWDDVAFRIEEDDKVPDAEKSPARVIQSMRANIQRGI